MVNDFGYSKEEQEKWWDEIDASISTKSAKERSQENILSCKSPQLVPSPDDADDNFLGKVTLLSRPGKMKLNKDITSAQTFVPVDDKPLMALKIDFKNLQGEDITIYAPLVNVHWHTHAEHARLETGQKGFVKKLGKAPEGTIDDRIEMHAVFASDEVPGLPHRVLRYALGQMLAPSKDAPENPELQKMVDLLPTEKQPKGEQIIDIDLSKLFLAKDITAYLGSLTTPTDGQHVIHLVPSRESDIEVPESQIKTMRELQEQNNALSRTSSKKTSFTKAEISR